MDIYERNKKVFKENRELSKTKFKSDTLNLISNTTVYLDTHCFDFKQLKNKPNIEFESIGTISALVRYRKESKRLAILNFADALVPGGLVEFGETTQEEDICRCSNLYESLISQSCMSHYYQYNKSLNSYVYSDRIIYSRGVRLLRYDSTYSFTTEPIYFDVITCPSPSTKVRNDILLRRILGILNVARDNKVDTIILGAWGCGAFGQDAYNMGACFGKVLSSCNYFKTVVFAIKDTDDKGNFTPFHDGFWLTYNN